MQKVNLEEAYWTLNAYLILNSIDWEDYVLLHTLVT